MNVSAYLDRIHHPQPPLKPDVETLVKLQRAHMQNVPFENLNIGLNRPIRLDQPSLWDKIIAQNRGGFCYELNGLFAWLLQQIGYEVTYLNARVFDRAGNPGIEFGHLTLLVQIPGEHGRWLVDVGFGDSFNEPLILEEPGEQLQDLRAYTLESVDEGYVLWRKNYDGAWERKYSFNLIPHKFPEEYETACLYHQTSPTSTFTTGNIISRATPDGRVSLEVGRLIITRNGQRTERPISTEEYQVLLKEYFDVIL